MPAIRRKRCDKHQKNVLRLTQAEFRALTRQEKRAFRKKRMEAMIADAQEETEVNALPYQPFYRLVKETSEEFKYHMLFSKDAVEALRVATEAHMTELFEHAQMAATHAKRKTVMVEDLQFVCAMNPAKFKHEGVLWN